MLTRLITHIRNRWHPLWRLRQLPGYRRFQERFDRTVYTRIPDTGLRVAVKRLRDASWILTPASLEPEIRSAFTLVLELLKPEVFWDIGANIGFYSWFVRQHPAVRQVIMFEPDPTNFALINQTIRKNAVADCCAKDIALSDRNGQASFLVDRASGATGSLEATSHRENRSSLHHAYQLAETITCVTATVDRLIAEGVPPPDLMKIDVEGAEHLVISGAEACLLQRAPALIMETSNMELVRRLCNLGYEAYRIDDGNVLFIPARLGLDRALFSCVFAECELGGLGL